MKNTGTAIVSALVGVVIGFGIARLVQEPTCSDQLIVVNPSAPSTQLGDRYVCKDPGHLVTWRSTNGAPIKVEWVSIDPTTAPYPYTLNCNYTSSDCFSGPMSPNAQVGSKAKYKLTFQTGQTFNGRIIIQR
jgi:hypothetical protein